jgi:hypothetical protein
MAIVECPTCDISTVIGLPSDTTVESISAKGVIKTFEDGRKTRKVNCSQGHDVYVTFSTEVPDHSNPFIMWL